MNQNCQRGGAYAIARKFPVNRLKTFTKKANGFENLNVRYLAFLEGDPSQRPHSHRGHNVTLTGWHRMFSRCSHLLPASLRTSARNPSSKFVQTQETHRYTILLLPWYCTIVYCTVINMYNNLSNYVLIIHCFLFCCFSGVPSWRLM